MIPHNRNLDRRPDESSGDWATRLFWQCLRYEEELWKISDLCLEAEQQYCGLVAPTVETKYLRDSLDRAGIVVV